MRLEGFSLPKQGSNFGQVVKLNVGCIWGIEHASGDFFLQGFEFGDLLLEVLALLRESMQGDQVLFEFGVFSHHCESMRGGLY